MSYLKTTIFFAVTLLFVVAMSDIVDAQCLRRAARCQSACDTCCDPCCPAPQPVECCPTPQPVGCCPSPPAGCGCNCCGDPVPKDWCYECCAGLYDPVTQPIKHSECLRQCRNGTSTECVDDTLRCCPPKRCRLFQRCRLFRRCR